MTITEILKNDLHDESLSMLAVSCMAYTVCFECGHVDDGVQTLVNLPCKTCGRIIERRTALFLSEHKIVETIFECYRSTESKHLCVLLFCTLIEQHVAKLVHSRFTRLGTAPLLVELLLEKYWRVDERMKLFARISGTTIRAALGDGKHHSAFDTYSSLQRKRNSIAHGKPWGHLHIESSDIDRAVDHVPISFAAMARLYHRFCSIDAPPLPSRS